MQYLASYSGKTEQWLKKQGQILHAVNYKTPVPYTSLMNVL